MSITLRLTDNINEQEAANADAVELIVGNQIEIIRFLEDRLPECETLFCRNVESPTINPLTCNNANEYLTPNYPALPPIRIGELQWPSGASRYARALYVVDWWTMKRVAEYCWGWTAPLNDPQDIPDEWGSTANYSLQVAITRQNASTTGLADPFVARMKPLRPYRVSGAGADCWLLPLVDDRYEAIRKMRDPTEEEPSDWDSFLESLVTDTGLQKSADQQLLGGTVDNAYGNVDERLYKTGKPQPASALLDVAAHSVGLRAVCEPRTNAIFISDQGYSQGLRLGGRLQQVADQADANLYTGETNPLLIAGGKRSNGDLPGALKIHHANGTEEVSIDGGNDGLSPLELLSTWDNDDEVTDFAEKVAEDIAAWSDGGSQFCFLSADVLYYPCGYDDFASIILRETAPDEYQFQTRIHELPGLFHPKVLLVGGFGSECEGGIKRFRLVTDLTGDGPAYARECDRSGDFISSTLQKVYGHSLLLDGAKPGYIGTYNREDGEWVDTAFGCITPCETEGQIAIGSPPAGTVGDPYTHTVLSSGLDGDMSISGLPAGLSFDGATGEITGTPTEAGSFVAIVTGDAESTDELTTCTITKAAEIVISEAE